MNRTSPKRYGLRLDGKLVGGIFFPRGYGKGSCPQLSFYHPKPNGDEVIHVLKGSHAKATLTRCLPHYPTIELVELVPVYRDGEQWPVFVPVSKEENRDMARDTAREIMGTIAKHALSVALGFKALETFTTYRTEEGTITAKASYDKGEYVLRVIWMLDREPVSVHGCETVIARHVTRICK